MKQKRVKIGDVIEIPLPDGRKAYGQYVFRDEKAGPLIQVFDLIVKDKASLAQIRYAKPLFPPIVTGLDAAIRAGLWRIVGNMAVENFVYPKFIDPLYDSKADKVRTWYLWDGKKYHNLGRQLPNEYKHLEQLVGWDPNNIAKRIITGENPYDYILNR